MLRGGGAIVPAVLLVSSAEVAATAATQASDVKLPPDELTISDSVADTEFKRLVVSVDGVALVLLPAASGPEVDVCQHTSRR